MADVLYKHNQITDVKYRVESTTAKHVILRGTTHNEQVTVTKADFEKFYTRVVG